MAAIPGEAVPANVRDRLTRGLLDAISAALRGAARSQPQWWGQDEQLALPIAAYRHGKAIHRGDPISAAVGELAATCGWSAPVMLTAAAARRTGEELLTAAAVGAELAVRLHAVAAPTLLARGIHPSASGMLGATATAARLLATDADQVGWALGIAACRTPSALLAGYRWPATIGETYLAHPAAQAVAATELAVSGVRGLDDWVNPWFTALAPEADPAGVVDRLGERWYTATFASITTAELVAAATALAEQVRAASVSLSEIEGIVVHGGNLAHLPTGSGDGAVSVPALLVNALTTAVPADPAVAAALSQRIQPAGFGMDSPLTLTLRTGAGALLRAAAPPPGDAGQRWQAALERYREVADDLLGRARAAQLLDLISGLADLPDASVLLRQLAAPIKPRPAPRRGRPAAPTLASPAGLRGPALARFIAGTSYADLPTSVVAAVKRSVLDAIGCACYGQQARTVGLARAHVSRTRDTESSLWHTGQTSTAAGAALVNGTAIHATELSESFTRAAVHPGTPIVPAVLAVGERAGASGAAVIAGVAVGYEVAIRLGLAFGGILLAQGLHSPTLAGTFGVAAGAARLREYDCDTAGHALAIAACRVPSAMWAAAFQHADVKDFFQAHAAALAIDAADLAGSGETGPVDWLERWFGAVPRRPRLDGLTETLGDFWWLTSGGLHFKELPVMAMAAPTLGALRQILSRTAVAPADVERVVVASSGRIRLNHTYPPHNVVSARGSIPFLVSAILHAPADFLADPYFLSFITDARICDGTLARIAQRVQLQVDPVFDEHMEHSWPLQFEARVTIYLTNGETVVGYDDTWARTSTMRYEDVAEKFRAMCHGRLDPAAIESVIDRVSRLEELDDVRQIAAAGAGGALNGGGR